MTHDELFEQWMDKEWPGWRQFQHAASGMTFVQQKRDAFMAGVAAVFGTTKVEE